MSIVSLEEVLVWLDLEDDTYSGGIIQTVLDGVDAFVKNYCHRNFESIEYTEYFDGDGEKNLYLPRYPISDVSLYIGDDDDIEEADLVDADDYIVYEYGRLYKSSGFTSGHKNIKVIYTAGFSADDMPKDLKLACKILIQVIYDKRDEEGFGLEKYSIERLEKVFEEMPVEARRILDSYRKRRV